MTSSSHVNSPVETALHDAIEDARESYPQGGILVLHFPDVSQKVIDTGLGEEIAELVAEALKLDVEFDS